MTCPKGGVLRLPLAVTPYSPAVCVCARPLQGTGTPLEVMPSLPLAGGRLEGL